IALPAGDLYGFRASAGEGYYPVSDQLSTQNLGSYTEITRDLMMVPVRKNEVIRLNNLFFDSGEHVLRPESLPELDRLVAFMLKSATIVIELSGHTDNVGSPAANQRLSQDRVDSVREYLVQNGIDPKRLKAVGYGARKPLANNSTEEGRQQNRRVEFKILTI
ncbi:MAG: OmpA family protein, partial [Candidatus Kapaibacteriota bacterium]